jgi:CRISPR-associated endoribonuclease Cas2 subtype I-E
MQVFVVRNPTTAIKGLLRSRGLEVDPNVFVLSVTKKVASEIFEELVEKGSKQPTFRVTLVEDDRSTMGVSVRGYGDNTPSTETIDGIELKCRKKKPLQTPANVDNIPS